MKVTWGHCPRVPKENGGLRASMLLKSFFFIAHAKFHNPTTIFENTPLSPKIYDKAWINKNANFVKYW